MKLNDSVGAKAIRVLATDLDGTFIPLAENETNRQDLIHLQSLLCEQGIMIVFVTGRHLASVKNAIETIPLPSPDFIICDVGSSIYHRDDNLAYNLVANYAAHLDRIIESFPIERLRSELAELQGLRLQEPEKQGRFKLSYYVDADCCEEMAVSIQSLLNRRSAPYGIIHSIDPFNGDGLIDLLPQGVTKAYAMDWWAEHYQYPQESVIFAGDSGNDFAALTAGFRSIIVANADRKLMDHVQQVHAQNPWQDRLHVAQSVATSGVLEGVRRFLRSASEE